MKRLYRSDKERMLSGVCGGLAIYFNVDPTLIRLLWVLLFFMNPLMIVVYIIGAIIIPIAPEGVFYDFYEEPEKLEHESEIESKPEE
ncbi:phage shock protein C, PspC [Methanococcus maripaludis C5]|uniref:Phage shock protein C, PspC n=1 Tax=Methanococcus maripaludis (strain C5 / ATCC BAA-1333) TaxID=402880 RepID=A4FWE3_METM5|nr:PspC domain-containing protein [Methanococcus maripaludis]ABO34518.1 phage shock protein C, PspC [Methanococcus maripaludis C5]